ncbi:MAG: metal-sensitive transcriptional regulator [Armatimonadota bacterium]
MWYILIIPYPLGYLFWEDITTDTEKDVTLRLKRIEGQIRGLQRMIEEGQDCTEVIHQLCAARKALDKVGFIILTHKMQDCVKGGEGSRDPQASMKEAMELFLALA